ncbi:MAG: hypothetical protein RJB01_1761 [Actinomycetota bacterium]|jgi:hypothetical protein
MSAKPQDAIDALIERAGTDSALRERLLADASATIAAETGMKVPAEWDIVAREVDGAIEIGFVDGELPDAYLELVAGGSKCDSQDGAADPYPANPTRQPTW